MKHELQSPEKMKFSTKKKNITKIDNRQYFDELINANPGFTQFPNFIFSLNLSKHALPVFLYLMRCANRLKDNICYPSVKNIAKNCSISSETTVSKAIKELETRGLITKNNTGRNNIYKIEEAIYLAIDKANKKDQDTSVLEATPTHSGGIESEEKGILTIPSHSDGTPPLSDGKYHHHMVPNNTNIIKLNNNTKEEENSKNGKRDIPSKRNITSLTEGLVQTQNILGEAMKPKSSAREKPNTFAEADRYFKTLNEEEKADFDVSAAKLSPYITSLVIRRRRYFQELQEVHTVRLEGEPTFTIPAETKNTCEPVTRPPIIGP